MELPANLLAAVPLLHVSCSEKSERFYCDDLGFAKMWEHRPGSGTLEPGYLGLRRDAVSLHLSSFAGDGVAGGVASFYVRDVDALFEEFAARGVPIEMPPCDQTWGNREMYIRDGDGNSLRFLQSKRLAPPLDTPAPAG